MRGDRVAAPPIRAAGGVLWRRAADAAGAAGAAPDEPPGVEVAIIHRPRYDDWSLPKGKLAPGEPDMEGAVREVLEETGYHVRVGRPLGETRYLKEDGPLARVKVVRWWAMEAEEGGFAPTREVDELRWLPLAEAEELLTRDSDRSTLQAFARGPAPTRAVLVVRHATAGSRADWAGDDFQRPLDDHGWAQADEIVRHLARFGIGEVISADNLRCVQTVEPLADALDLPIRREPLLSAEGYPGHEEEAVKAVRSAGSTGRDAVVCSQGEVIPDLIERLAEEDGFLLEGPVQTRKGSIWALSIDLDGRLVATDYIPEPYPSMDPNPVPQLSSGLSTR
ncbi:MAG: NUDIX hydrolase [Candidatus Limnocylindria bacterium]